MKVPNLWRVGFTHVLKGSSVKTSLKREKEIKRQHQELWDFIYGTFTDYHETPEMRLIVESDARVRKVRDILPYPNPQTQRFNISGIGRAGILRGTLLLPVSAHTGIENAEKWAKTDKYDVFRVQEGRKKTLVRRAPSLGIVTVQEIEVLLSPENSIEIQYQRGNSAESSAPSSHPAARIIEIYWDGT